MVIAMPSLMDQSDYSTHVRTYESFVRGLVRIVTGIAIGLVVLAYFTT
jgi:Bacterial aa3 type cytochrome c oxidase subunit IV